MLGVAILVWILIATISDAARFRNTEQIINSKQDAFISLQGLRTFIDKVDSVSKHQKKAISQPGAQKDETAAILKTRIAALAHEGTAKLDQLERTVAAEKYIDRLRILLDKRLQLLESTQCQAPRQRRSVESGTATLEGIDSEIKSIIALIEKREAASLLDLTKRYASSHGSPMLPYAVAVALAALLVGIVFDLGARVMPHLRKGDERSGSKGKKRAELSPERQILNATHRKLPAYMPASTAPPAPSDQVAHIDQQKEQMDQPQSQTDQRVVSQVAQASPETAPPANQQAATQGEAPETEIQPVRLISAEDVSDIVRRVQDAGLPVVLPEQPRESYSYSDFQRQVDPLPERERALYPQPGTHVQPASSPAQPGSSQFQPASPHARPAQPSSTQSTSEQSKKPGDPSKIVPPRTGADAIRQPKVWNMPAWRQTSNSANPQKAAEGRKDVDMSDSGSWDIDTLFGWPPRPEIDNTARPGAAEDGETIVDVEFEEIAGWDLPEDFDQRRQNAAKTSSVTPPAQHTIESQQVTVKDMRAILSAGDDTASGASADKRSPASGADAGHHAVKPGTYSNGFSNGSRPIGQNGAGAGNGFGSGPAGAAGNGVNGSPAVQALGSVATPFADSHDRYTVTPAPASAQKAAEIVRDDRAARLSDAELQRTTGEYSSLFWTSSRDGKLEFMSPKWYQYTGTSAQQNEGLGWLMLLHPADRDRILPLFESSSFAESIDLEFRVLGKDGIYRPFATRRMPIKDNGGEVIKWCGSLKLVETQFS